jgi:methionyl aminopeptidase
MNRLPLLFSSPLRSVSTVCRRPGFLKRYVTNSHFDTEELQQVEDFGVYNVILPEEPFVWGVSHIPLRAVPDHIARPPYALRHDRSMSLAKSETDHGEHYDGDGRINLGSIEEERVRSAATLARNVRNYAGSLVQVSTSSISNVDTA